MSDWKCGKCGREYASSEHINLPKIQVNPDDIDPRRGAGYTSVCEDCGYVFHKDKWSIRETLTIETKELGSINIDVSTVFLELDHGFGGTPLWYETMCFPEKGSINCDGFGRYTTQEEAEKGHEEIKNALLNGKFTIEATEYSLYVQSSEKTQTPAPEVKTDE